MSNTADRDCRSDEIALFVKPLRMAWRIVNSLGGNGASQNVDKQMNKYQIITRLAQRFGVTYLQAENALVANDWIEWMAAGDLRDELAGV